MQAIQAQKGYQAVRQWYMKSPHDRGEITGKYPGFPSEASLGEFCEKFNLTLYHEKLTSDAD